MRVQGTRVILFLSNQRICLPFGAKCRTRQQSERTRHEIRNGLKTDPFYTHHFIYEDIFEILVVYVGKV